MSVSLRRGQLLQDGGDEDLARHQHGTFIHIEAGVVMFKYRIKFLVATAGEEEGAGYFLQVVREILTAHRRCLFVRVCCTDDPLSDGRYPLCLCVAVDGRWITTHVIQGSLGPERSADLVDDPLQRSLRRLLHGRVEAPHGALELDVFGDDVGGVTPLDRASRHYG